jgi:DNA-binding transcriptional ArsR family regulator
VKHFPAVRLLACRGVAELRWEELAKASMHRLQVRILERAAGIPQDRFSPIGLATEFGEPLGNVSYHVRVLLERGLLKKAGSTPRRGAVQHHYRIASKALR